MNVITLILSLIGIAPTTDRALKGINKALKDLESVQQAQANRIGKARTQHSRAEIRHRRAVERILAREEAASAEYTKARRVAEKMSDLVS